MVEKIKKAVKSAMKHNEKNKKIICRDIYGKPHKTDVNLLAFRPSIYGILIEKGRVLLSKQWDGYDFPGGGADLNETIDQTLEREFWEETGFKVKNQGMVYYGNSFFYSVVRKKYWNCYMFYFLVKRIGGKLSKANFDEHEKKYADLAEWVDLKDLNKIKFYNIAGSKKNIDLINKAKKLLTL